MMSIKAIESEVFASTCSGANPSLCSTREKCDSLGSQSATLKAGRGRNAKYLLPQIRAV